jgi:hypothetical protein
MFRYTLDGISFSDPLGGVTQVTANIVRDWQGSGIDNLIKESLEGSLTFTGNAYCYLCDKSADICAATDVVIYDSNNDIFFEGVVKTYMLSFNLTKRSAEAQIKEMSFANLVRDKAGFDVYLKSGFTIGCETLAQIPIQLNIFRDGNGTPYLGRRISFDALDALQFIISFITDNQVTVSSTFLTNKKIAIATKAAMTWDFVRPPGFVLIKPERFFWPSVSFDTLFSEIRKKYPIFMVIDGNNISIELEDDAFSNNKVFDITGIPYDTEVNADTERLKSSITVGSNNTDFEDSSYITFEPNKFRDWQQAQFNSCGCESDKDNDLDLVNDFVIDSNVILETLASGYEEDADTIFMYEYDGSDLANKFAVFVTDPNDGTIYYNDDFRNDLTIERFQNWNSGCLFAIRGNDIQFDLVCDPLVDPFVCTVAPPSGITPQSVKGYMNFIAPAMVVADSQGTFPVVTGLPTDFIPGGANGYGINAPGYYIFQARGSWGLNVLGVVDLAEVTISVVVYSEYAATTEIYRKDETQSFINTGSIGAVQLDIISDFIYLPVGAVVVIELSSNVTSAIPRAINQTFGRTFWRIPSEEYACFDVPTDGQKLPYVYRFSHPLCKADYQQMIADKSGYVYFGGVQGWIRKVGRNIMGEGTFELLAQNIACAQETCVWRVEGLIPTFCVNVPQLINIESWGNASFSFTFTADVDVRVVVNDGSTITAAQIMSLWEIEWNQAVLDGALVGLSYTYIDGILCIQSSNASDVFFQFQAGFNTTTPPITVVQDYDFGTNIQPTTFIAFIFPNTVIFNSASYGGTFFAEFVTFQIFQNGEWTTVTPTGGVYESTTEFTAWRVLNGETIIESGEPEIICT